VQLWVGDHDPVSDLHAAWLAERLALAQRHTYVGGHLQSDDSYRSMLAWLAELEPAVLGGSR
jgi:hypothetical protein